MTNDARMRTFSPSRRSFLSLSACVLGLGLLSPVTALAQDNESQGSDMTASDYWAIAEDRARAEGSPIISGSLSDEELRELQDTPQTRSLMSITAKSDTVWVDYVFADSIQAVLVADHISSTTVGEFVNTWIQMTYCSVSNLTYKRTILDAGRTQAVSYVFTVTSPLATNSALECYCEFYYTGVGRLYSWSWI